MQENTQDNLPVVSIELTTKENHKQINTPFGAVEFQGRVSHDVPLRAAAFLKEANQAKGWRDEIDTLIIARYLEISQAADEGERDAVDIVDTESTEGDLRRLGCDPSDSFPPSLSSRCLLRSASFFDSSSSAAPFLLRC